MKEKTQAKIGWALITGVVIFVLWMATSITSCTDAYAPIQNDTQQEFPDIYNDPQTALNPYCPDSGFMLNTDDILADYNSPNLEVVYSVDSVDLTEGEVKISPIYSTDNNQPICVPYYWQRYDSAYGQNQIFTVKCKEFYAQWVVDIDTCQ